LRKLALSSRRPFDHPCDRVTNRIEPRVAGIATLSPDLFGSYKTNDAPAFACVFDTLIAQLLNSENFEGKPFIERKGMLRKVLRGTRATKKLPALDSAPRAGSNIVPPL